MNININDKIKKMIDMKTFGLDERLASEAAAYGEFPVGRVLSQSRDLYRVVCEAGELLAVLSGVGKSTLINCLIGQDILATGGLRDDGKGRHTTTWRELILLPNGGLVIDTPGMRELGLESVELNKAFADLAELAACCRFRDCTHSGEPGCAVQRAIDKGRLTQERLASYQKLQREAKYEGLNSRQLEEVKLESMFREYGGFKNARKIMKSKTRRK